jgi:hypothetical protein
MMRRRPRRPQLRTRVLAGVLAVTLVALVAFDVAAVTALHGYLLAQTDGRLQSVQPAPPRTAGGHRCRCRRRPRGRPVAPA